MSTLSRRIHSVPRVFEPSGNYYEYRPLAAAVAVDTDIYPDGATDIGGTVGAGWTAESWGSFDGSYYNFGVPGRYRVTVNMQIFTNTAANDCRLTVWLTVPNESVEVDGSSAGNARQFHAIQRANTLIVGNVTKECLVTQDDVDDFNGVGVKYRWTRDGSQTATRNGSLAIVRIGDA